MYTTSAHADVPEEIFRGFGAALSGFVNFRRCHRLGKGQFRIFHHHPPHQRNEQHPQDAAHHNQRGGFPVRVSAGETKATLSQSETRES